MPDAKTVELMIDRLNLIWNANFDKTEKDSWKEKINETIRAVIERTCRKPVVDYDAAIATLNDLLDLRWGYEDIVLKRNILALTEKKPNSTLEEIIAANKTGSYLRRFIEALENLDNLLEETGQLKKSVVVRKQLIWERKSSRQGDLDD